MTLTVAAYNVHRCIGGDGRRDPERVLQVLRELDADVIALQELEWDAAAPLDLLTHFARSLRSTGIAGPTLVADRDHYGNAVLTRLPVLTVQHIDLSVPGRERRGALDVELDARGSVLRVIATHLGLAPTERRQQIRRILSSLPKSRHDPVVLMGDLNEWFLWGRPLRWLRQHFGHAPALATFPARYPVAALDHIWVQPPALRKNVSVLSTHTARAASDHLPVRMILDWPDIRVPTQSPQ
jgi:endonuclease/exonuclease/phosphatase family metal-dependent hydrolase